MTPVQLEYQIARNSLSIFAKKCPTLLVMKRRFIVLAALVALTACGKEPEKAAFTGTWEITQENVIAMKTEKNEITVATAPPKFRIAEKSSTVESVEVYDGKSLHRRTAYISQGGYGEPSGSDFNESSSHTYSEAMTPEQSDAKRFWVQPLQGKSSAGGLIAGRDTILYQGASRRPEGEFDIQVWADAATGVVLKSVETVYSSQVKSIVTRNSRECKSIDFTPPADAVFARP